MNAVERCAALVLLLALAPFLVFIGILIRVLSGQSPLVSHLRVGRNWVPFRMLKFRTMWNSVPGRGNHGGLVELVVAEPGAGLKRSDDPRVNGYAARFLRKYSIDELPQLAHVLSGRMSLVGPRPLTKGELLAQYGPEASETLKLAPGITGLWQVMGRSRLAYRQRRRLDLFYVRHRSVRMYLWVLARTIPRVLTGRDSW
ncbi:MAG: sugar transferase [Acidobacteriota bacterium]